MPARLCGIAFCVGLLVLLTVSCIEPVGQERQPTPTPPAPHQTPTPTPENPPTVVPVSPVPPEVEQFAAEWPMVNKDYGNTRATMDSEINTANVEQLGLAWAFPLQGAAKWGADLEPRF